MKSRTLISFLIVLDLSLAAVLGWGIRNRSAGASPGERGSPPAMESLPAAVGGENAPVGREAGTRAISPSRRTPLWASLRSRDLRTFAANLRAAGCPEDTVRDIILAEVNRLFAPRERPLRLRRRHQLPWEKPSLHPLAIEENLRKLRKLVREKQELLSQALGYRVFLEAPELSTRH